MSTSQAFSSAGSKLYISNTPLNLAVFTGSSADFAAVSYTQILEVTEIGAIGKSYAVQNHMPVGTDETFKIKTTSNAGQLPVKGAYVPTDPGQLLLVAARDAKGVNGTYAIKIATAIGTFIYCQATVLDYVTTIGNSQAITMFDSKIELSGTPVYA